jgi:hypothetical protein
MRNCGVKAEKNPISFFLPIFQAYFFSKCGEKVQFSFYVRVFSGFSLFKAFLSLYFLSENVGIAKWMRRKCGEKVKLFGFFISIFFAFTHFLMHFFYFFAPFYFLLFPMSLLSVVTQRKRTKKPTTSFKLIIIDWLETTGCYGFCFVCLFV